MEWIFVLAVLLGPLLLAGGFGVVLYLHDPEGWKRTLTRASKVSRATLEPSKPVPAVEQSKAEQQAVEEWTAEFSGKPLPVPASKLKHEIVKTDYYSASVGGYWPQYHCKCGASETVPVISRGGIREAEQTALLKGKQHVDSMNDAEEKMRKSDGKFAF